MKFYNSQSSLPLETSERRVGDTYPPKKLPDHRGEYFNHSKARLVQRDFKDIDGTLIAPHELYEKLTEGTLILVQVSLVTYIIADDKKKVGSFCSWLNVA